MMKTQYYIGICVLVFGFLSLFESNSANATETLTTKPLMKICISTEFDTTFDTSFAAISKPEDFLRVYEKYFNEARIERLLSRVNYYMLEALSTKSENLGIDVLMTDDPDTCTGYSSYQNYFRIKNTVWIDDYRSFYISAAVASANGDTIFNTSSKRLLKDEAFYSSTYWQELQDTTQSIQMGLLNSVLDNLASNLVNLIGYEVAQGLIESNYKLRVKVDDFVQLDKDAQFGYLGKGIKAMVEIALSRSEAIIVYTDEDLGEQYGDSGLEEPTDIMLFKPNYKIRGSFFHVNEAMFIDLKCVKLPYNRILASGKVSIDTMNISELSSKVTDISNRLKNTMMVDFHQSLKSLAIVPAPPIRYFSSNEKSREGWDIAKLVTRNMTNKLQLLLSDTKMQDAQQNLKIYEISSKTIDEYMNNRPSPADIINDLDIDYLILLQIEDMGHSINMSSTLHSYDLERPALAEYVYQKEASKENVEPVIDSTVLHISARLCDMGVLRSPQFCSLNQQKPDSIAKILGGVRVIDFQKKKSVGIRIGPTYHINPAIFLGRESTEYFEIFFAHKLKHMPWLPSWLGNELEVSIGYDVGAGNIFRKGMISGNGIFNYKIVFDKYKYAEFPVILGAGIGVGCIGASYRYEPGDLPYIGDKSYRRGVLRTAFSILGSIEMPLSGRLKFQGILRWLIQRSTITHYENIPLDDSIENPPRGSLETIALIGGVKYIWR
jgi:hypothetical protein